MDYRNGIPGPTSTGGQLPPQLATLPSWNLSLNNALKSVVVIGDSEGAGFYAANQVTQGWVGLATTTLQNAFRNHGLGLITKQAENQNGHYSFTSAGTWTGESSIGPNTDGPSVFSATGTGAGYSASVSQCLQPVMADGFTVLTYTASDTGGNFAVSIDGGTPVVLSHVATSTPAVVFDSVSAGAYGSHQICIGPNGSASKAYFYGVNPTIGVSGVSIHNLSISGAQTSNWGSTVGSAGGMGWIQSLNPDLVIVSLGINDLNAGVPVGTMAANMTNILNAAEAVTTTVGPEQEVDPNFATPGNWIAGTGWSVTGGAAVATAATGLIYSQTSPAIQANAKYQITYTVSSYTSGSFRSFIEGASPQYGATHSAVGTYTDTFAAGAGYNGGVGIFPVSGPFIGSVKNISVKQILGSSPPSIVIFGEPPNGAADGASKPLWTAYRAALNALATTYGAMYLDVTSRWGTYASALAHGYIVAQHPSTAGHQDEASYLLQNIFDASYVLPTIAPSTTPTYTGLSIKNGVRAPQIMTIQPGADTTLEDAYWMWNYPNGAATGDPMWKLGNFGSVNTFQLIDSQFANLSRLSVQQGATTDLNSRGTFPIRFNMDPGSATAGTIFGSGGSFPNIVATIDGTGKGIFTGISTGTAGSTAKATCWKTATTIGYCSTQPDSTGSCTCN